MTKILYAGPVINKCIDSLKAKSLELAARGTKPKLSVILVGKNPASLIYLKNKKKFCQKIDADFELITLPESTNESDFLAAVKRLNDNPLVTGCFVQLPMPKHLQHINITQLINPEKDVDGFHLNTVAQLYLKDLTGIIPCTPRGIKTLLSEYKIDVAGKNIVIIGRSYIVGKPLSLLLTAMDATVTLCHSKTNNLIEHTQKADIIISAIGIAHFIKKEHLNSNGNQIIIDVGMNSIDGKTVGDVDFDDVKDHCQAITPVPGGVGPMTVFSLMENLLRATENIQSRKNT